MSYKKKVHREPITLNPVGPTGGAGNVLTKHTLWMADGTAIPRGPAIESQNENRDPPVVSYNLTDLGARRNEVLKSDFIIKFVEAGRGNQEEAEEAWKKVSKAKFALDGLLEAQTTKIIDFKKIEECLRIIYLNQPIPPKKQELEKTIERYRFEWTRDQKNVKSMMQARRDPDEVFRERVLNPETRKDAIEYYLKDHVDRAHFFLEAIELLFELNDNKRKRG